MGKLGCEAAHEQSSLHPPVNYFTVEDTLRCVYKHARRIQEHTFIFGRVTRC
jgi:hypothetical protein